MINVKLAGLLVMVKVVKMKWFSACGQFRESDGLSGCGKSRENYMFTCCGNVTKIWLF